MRDTEQTNRKSGSRKDRQRELRRNEMVLRRKESRRGKRRWRGIERRMSLNINSLWPPIRDFLNYLIIETSLLTEKNSLERQR